ARARPPRENPATRVVDCTGDQPAVLGLAGEPEPGVRDWLRAGPQAPTDALDRLPRGARGGRGGAAGGGGAWSPAGPPALAGVLPEAGAAPAVALQADPRPTFCD